MAAKPGIRAGMGMRGLCTALAKIWYMPASTNSTESRIEMGMSKTDVNFRRLLAAAPQRQNHFKLIHYVATLRELLEQLTEGRTPEGLPRVSSAVVNDYSKKIDDIASELTATLPNIKVSQEPVRRSSFKQSPKSDSENQMPSPGLRRRVVPTASIKDRIHVTTEPDTSAPIKLDTAAEVHIQKHMNRKYEEDLTYEMVGLAQLLKESSLMLSRSLEKTEKILDSTERAAVEHSLASTEHANVRAIKIYSETSKTTCFQWLLIIVMTCIFIVVVLRIRVT